VIIAGHLVQLTDAVPQLTDQALHIRPAGQRVPAAMEDLQLEANINQLIRGGRVLTISQRIQTRGAVVVLLEFACGGIETPISEYSILCLPLRCGMHRGKSEKRVQIWEHLKFYKLV